MSFFFSLLEKCKYKTKYAAVHGQVMHSSAVCNLFSKRWSGSICEQLGGKAAFGDTLKYIVSSASSTKPSITKKKKKKKPEDCE